MITLSPHKSTACTRLEDMRDNKKGLQKQKESESVIMITEWGDIYCLVKSALRIHKVVTFRSRHRN